ncbi:subtilisin-like protein [Lactarius hatsudake]|nr:subtilisin-like protein [Lactarius hatsudake]
MRHKALTFPASLRTATACQCIAETLSVTLVVMRHHLIPVLSLIAAILLGSLAKPFSPRWDNMRIKHSWNAVPENWECLGNPLSGITIDLYVSDPNHPRRVFSATPSLMHVAELVSPPSGTLELVNSWLEHHGVPSSGVSIIRANALLGASYQLYRHVETNETVVRTVGYALPAALHRLVQTVVPTTCFSTPHTQWQSPRKRPGGATAGLKKPVSGEPVTVLLSRDDDYATPSFLRSLYKTAEYTAHRCEPECARDLGILNEYPSPEDPGDVHVNGGGYDPTNPTSEGNLDTQYAVAMTYPTPVIFYSVGQGPTGTTRLACVLVPLPPHGGLISRGRSAYLYSAYSASACSSRLGDDGVGPGDCLADDGTVRFISNFPPTCPYVTAVGGTTGLEPEAVTTFLQHLGNQYQGKYNATSRGIPDISAQALNFPIFIKGQKKIAYGTSGSAPIVATIVSLLNDYLISQGRATLGFLNPLAVTGVGTPDSFNACWPYFLTPLNLAVQVS